MEKKLGLTWQTVLMESNTTRNVSVLPVFFHFSCSKKCRQSPCCLLKWRIFSLNRPSKYYVKIICPAICLHRKYPSRYFQLQSAFIVGHGAALCVNHSRLTVLLFVHKHQSHSIHFYFVFISSVNLPFVARIKTLILKIQHATKPVC